MVLGERGIWNFLEDKNVHRTVFINLTIRTCGRMQGDAHFVKNIPEKPCSSKSLD